MKKIMQNKLRKLDSIRGLAATYVVLHHTISPDLKLFNAPIGLFFKFGQESVIIFFILSGFVVNYSFSRGDNKKFFPYFLNRLLRIYVPLMFIFPLGYFLQCIKSESLINPNISNLILNIMMLQDASELKPNVITPPYMGNLPLWSLSYEWWFYMLYFPIQRYIKSEKNKLSTVIIASSISAIIYIYSPSFIPRIIMYLSIWWSGVHLSNIFMRGEKLSLSNICPSIINLSIISVILIINAVFLSKSGKISTIGVHPLLEVRHHIFTLIALISFILWRNSKWIMFDKIVGPFSILAPISYVMYVIHQYITVNATYLSFLNNKIIEFLCYVTILIAISWVLEVIICKNITARIKQAINYKF